MCRLPATSAAPNSTVPACNLPHRNKRLYDGDSDGKSETYPVELFVKHPSPNIAIVEYTRETLFQHKGRSVEITIKQYAP